MDADADDRSPQSRVPARWESPKIFDMAGPSDGWAKIRDESQQLRLDFIRTELDTSRTFARLASTEYKIGDREAGERCKRESEKAYRTVLRFLPELKCEEEKREFEGTLRDLREMLDALTCTKRTSTSKL